MKPQILFNLLKNKNKKEIVKILKNIYETLRKNDTLKK
jgi:hypothetical protein